MERRLGRSALRDFQNWGVDQIYNNEVTILAWEMGVGKGITALTAVDDLIEDEKVRRVLVVAPLNVATATFPDEIEAWSHLDYLKYTLIRAENDDLDIEARRREAYRFARDVIGMTPEDAQKFSGRMRTKFKEWKRRRLVGKETEVHIINKELLPWIWEHFGKKWPYDMVIVDEASMFKNGKRRTGLKKHSQFGAMAKARKFVKKIVLMTGTPTPKGLINLWGLLFIADLGERLGRSKTKFEENYFDSDYMGWNLEPKPGAEEKITKKISDVLFTLDPEDYPEIPPVVTTSRYVDLPKKALEEYRRFEKTLISEKYDIEAVNSGVLQGKLLQFANGSMYNEDGEDVWIHDKKLEYLEEIVEDAHDEPILIAYSYKFDLKRILKRWPKAVVFGKGDVREQKERWNKGKIPMMLGHPASIGHGQNIQFGGRLLTWYGLTSDLELYQQFNKRLARPGQTKKVYIQHILARETYDEKLIPLLNDRDVTQSRIMRRFIADYDI